MRQAEVKQQSNQNVDDRLYGLGGTLADDALTARQACENSQYLATGVALGRVLNGVAEIVATLKPIYPHAIEAMQNEFGRLVEAVKGPAPVAPAPSGGKGSKR
jgi:hypothetical protein